MTTLWCKLVPAKAATLRQTILLQANAATARQKTLLHDGGQEGPAAATSCTLV